MLLQKCNITVKKESYDVRVEGEERILLLESQNKNNYFNKCVLTLHLINSDLQNTALFRRLLRPTDLKNRL